MRLLPMLALLTGLTTYTANALSLPRALNLPLGSLQKPSSSLAQRAPPSPQSPFPLQARAVGDVDSTNANDTVADLTDLVSWDNYTLSVMGQRVFVLSGEFHPWRLPSGVEAWRDIVQKAKSAGFNTISIYLHWGLSNPSEGVVDFEYFRAIQPVIDLCMESGMWMVMRPGPYINAETTAGGIPGWVVATEGELRTNSTSYFNAWQLYMNYVSEITAKNQISNGGPIIAVQVENEYYSNNTDTYNLNRTTYMEQLERNLRVHGVDVPTMHNDPSPNGNYYAGPGATDIYGFDSYPQSFDCSNPLVWKDLPTNWHDRHVAINPDQPFWIPEFQGGAFDPWGSAAGYPACAQLTGPDFERVFYHALWAANVKLINFYMLFGGTSWAQLAFPGVYTSYDYGCPIQENRLLTTKYDEVKLQAFFLRSAREFYKTDWIADSQTDFLPSDLFVTYLRNPDTASRFYFVRHTNSSSFEETPFTLNVAVEFSGTTETNLELPLYSGNMTLLGRDHKLIVTNYHFGETTLAWSTASIMYSGTINGMDVLVLYGDRGQDSGLEFAIRGNETEPVISGDLDVDWTNKTANHQVFNFTTTSSGLSAIQVSLSLLVLVTDTITATTFWSPTISTSSASSSAVAPSSSSSNANPFEHFYSFGTNKTLLLAGPYLVRNATLDSSELAIVGDVNATSTQLLVYGGDEVESVSWNGKSVGMTRNSWGAWEGTIFADQTLEDELELPVLENWRWKDSLPEIKYGYDDSSWVLADHTETTNPFPPFNGSGPNILYANDYDYHAGNLLWRGAFEGSADQTGVELGISGGWAFAASVWLNEASLGYVWSRNGSDSPTINQTFPFPEGALQEGKTNWVTVLQDHMGYYESGNQGTPGGNQLDIKGPRGLQLYALQPPSPENQFTSWKVQGNLGGSTGFPDRVRGVYNEGGLFGERAGWHLPGFDDSDWTERSPVEGLTEPGVGFFRTTFDLAIPADLEVPINVVIGTTTKSDRAVRAQIYVNGWQYGRYISAVGPQYIFPIPRGILEMNGTNTLALSLWGMGDDQEDLSLESVYLTHDKITSPGVGPITTYSPGWNASERPGL